jgi:hypothetical protein
MRFKNFIIEALKPSQFRKYIKLAKKESNKHLLDHIFGNKDRIYEPFVLHLDDKIQSSTLDDLLTFFYEREMPVTITPEDYIKGYMVINGKRKRIGKFLAELLKTLSIEDQNLLKPIVKAYMHDKIRELNPNKKYLLCYSRHPYDIAGMSTDRGWTSCMELPSKKNPSGGAYHIAIDEDILLGTIIVYLIDENDKNINRPIGRVTVKPYYHIDTQDIIWVVCKMGYGTVPTRVFEQIKKFADRVNKNVKDGVYSLPPGIERSGFDDFYLKNMNKIDNIDELLIIDNIKLFLTAKQPDQWRDELRVKDKTVFFIDDIRHSIEQKSTRVLGLKFLRLAQENPELLLQFLQEVLDTMGFHFTERTYKFFKMIIVIMENILYKKPIPPEITTYNYVDEYMNQMKKAIGEIE